MNKIIFLSLFTFLLVGCSTPILHVVKPPQVDKEKSAMVTIFRKPLPLMDSMQKHWVILNNSPIFGLSGNQYSELNITSGQHTIELICYRHSYNYDVVALNKAPGSNHGHDEVTKHYKPTEKYCYEVAFEPLSLSCAHLHEKEYSVCDEIKANYKLIVPGENNYQN